MKHLVTLITFIFVTFVTFQVAYAGETVKDITAGSVVKFTAGIVTGVLIHEGAHGVAAKAANTEMSWELGNYNQPIGFTANPDSDAKGLALYSSGLLSQTMGTEIILQSDKDKIDKNSSFVRGVMAWNILNPILYSLDYWFIRRSNKNGGNTFQGDIEGVEYYSNEPTANVFALSITAMAAFQGYRYLQTQSWAPDWLKRNSQTQSLSFAPAPSGGFFMAFQHRF